jgi:hypothetical protein
LIHSLIDKLGLDPDYEFGRALQAHMGRKITTKELERARSGPWPARGVAPS